MKSLFLILILLSLSILCFAQSGADGLGELNKPAKKPVRKSEAPKTSKNKTASQPKTAAKVKQNMTPKVDFGQRSDLIVSLDFWRQQMNKALSRPGADDPLETPDEITDDDTEAQFTKISELKDFGYKIPMDFADLAELRYTDALVELPIATKTYVLDVGGSATDNEFTQFDFENGERSITPGSKKYNFLKILSDNFEGVKYDLNNPANCKNMRMRLLRMINPNSRKVLEEIASIYYKKFNIPLRITSLTRSMDYQILVNPNQEVDKNSFPPHISGCVFDTGRNHLSGEQQNFLMQVFAKMEREGKIEASFEGIENSAFHVFIYPTE